MTALSPYPSIAYISIPSITALLYYYYYLTFTQVIKEEFDSLLENKTFDLNDPSTRPPRTMKAISSRWVYKKKINPDGSTRFKARLVVRGFEQPEDNSPTYAPVAKIATYRVLLALSASRKWRNTQLDVKTAFLNPSIDDDDIFIKLPQGIPAEWFPPDTPAELIVLAILRLEKALYGLRTSPIRWYNMLDKFLRSLGFVKSDFEETLYLMDGCICLVYVDDIQLWATKEDTTACDNVISQLKLRFSMTSLGQTQRFLGLEVLYRDSESSIALCQQSYIDATIARFPMENVKPAHSPMDLNVQLFNGQVDDTPLSPRMMREYLSLVGSLVWISSSTRPDLAFTTSCLASFNAKPLKMHWTAALRALSYLRSTKDLGLVFNAPSKDPSPDLNVMTGHSDSDWASNVTTRKSQSGHVLSIAGSAVLWKSKPQKCVSLSTTEAEFYAASEAIKIISHTRALLKNVGSHLKDQDPVHDTLNPTPLKCDNAAAIKIFESGHFNERSKHIAVRVAHAFDETNAGTVKLEWIPSALNPADCLTKALNRCVHETQVDLIGMTRISLPPAALGGDLGQAQPNTTTHPKKIDSDQIDEMEIDDD